MILSKLFSNLNLPLLHRHKLFRPHFPPTSKAYPMSVSAEDFIGLNWWLGAVTGISYIAAAFFFKQYAFSVWCFFAAVISVFVYFIMNDISGAYKKSLPTTQFIHYDGGYTP
jgi:hypothetical protein